MQAPTTLTRDNRFNRLTAGAIGLALLAASTIGAIALNDQVELPLIGSDSQAQPAAVVDSMAQIQLVEQNSFDYVTPVATNQMRFAEVNSWDWTERAGLAGRESTTAVAPDYRFLEENIWGNMSLPPHGETGENY